MSADSEPRHDRLAYRTNGELREAIAYTVGGDPSRYGVGVKNGLLKADVRRIATALQPAADTTPIDTMDLGGLYEAVCRWAGSEYEPNAGSPWKLRRANLKAIHRALEARPPREVVSV